MANEQLQHPDVDAGAVYAPPARWFHWVTVAFILVLPVVGQIMVDDDNPFKLSDAFRAQMTSMHRTFGFILLWTIVARLFYRARNGAPADEPSLQSWEKTASHAVHWVLYALLIAVPFSGWFASSMYGERGIIFGFNLPQISWIDHDLADKIFVWHGRGAWLIVVLAAAHMAAALQHHFIKHDGVLRRMWPGLTKRD